MLWKWDARRLNWHETFLGCVSSTCQTLTWTWWAAQSSKVTVLIFLVGLLDPLAWPDCWCYCSWQYACKRLSLGLRAKMFTNGTNPPGQDYWLQDEQGGQARRVLPCIQVRKIFNSTHPKKTLSKILCSFFGLFFEQIVFRVWTCRAKLYGNGKLVHLKVIRN